jgi:RNA-dependent RNA polymerase
MDIFMRNIPRIVNHLDITLAIAQILHAPPFPTDPINFHVRLFGKGLGNITLPTEDVGSMFLRTCSRIKVKESFIPLQRSNRPVDQTALLYILSNPWIDPQVTSTQLQAGNQIYLESFSFGRFNRVGDFIFDTFHEGQVQVDLGRRQLLLINFEEIMIFGILLLDQMAERSATYASRQIKTLISIDPMYQVHRVFVVSRTPPAFGVNSERNPSWDGAASPPMFYSLSLNFRSASDKALFLTQCSYLRLPSPKIYRPVTCRQHENLSSSLDKLLAKLKFKLAFVVEKSVADGLLEVQEVIHLQDKIKQLSSDLDGHAAADVFRLFAENISSAKDLPKQLENARKRVVSRQGTNDSTQLPSPTLFYSYHLILTPTSRRLEGPLPDQSNSVLRRFQHHDNFLRVAIQDERCSKLRKELLGIERILESHFRPLLVHGLCLAGRKYEFLGYSMSGLKEHSVWFVRPWKLDTGGIMDAKGIRAQLVSFILFRCFAY